MIIKPKIRGFICTTAHPVGCAQNVKEQVDFVRSKSPIENGPKKVLIIGASTGYGLASRITAAFGSKAGTIGVFFEKEAEGKRTATAGWYNSVAFEQKARKEGLYARSFNGDAFSDEIKKKVVDAVKQDLGQIDCVIYSLASPRRTHPKTGVISKSVLKPKGKPFTNKSFNFEANKLETVTLQTATDDEIAHTIAVMGGEDWEMWIDLLDKDGCLSDQAMTVAYSYIGPEVTKDVYRNGTIGAAKDHLEGTAKKLNERLNAKGGHAFVSVNKALVTQSSSAIPFIPLYFTILNKVMKEKGVHEDCIAQIHRLFSQCLYAGDSVPVDEEGRIRIDNYEMQDDVQAEVQKRWSQITESNIHDLADIEGYNQEFLKLFGFGFDNVDYEADVDAAVSLQEVV